MKNGKLFAAFKTVDEKEQIVTGVLAEERVDKDNEIFDYATSKAYFEKWNQYFANKTAELGVEPSLGNLRVMHGKKVGGKFVEMTYDDDSKVIRVAAKVTDQQTWSDIMDGVYTGFSIGAKYVKKWSDSGSTRWTADPFEGSIVDNPCMYGATFEAVKADGVKEEKAFAGKNTGAEKGLYTVGYFAQMVCQLNDLAQTVAYEEEYEGDDAGAELADQIANQAKKLGDLLVQYTSNEVSELKEAAAVKSTEAGMRPKALPDEPGMRHPAKAEKTETVAAPAVTVLATETPVVAEKKSPKKDELLALVESFSKGIAGLFADQGETSAEGADAPKEAAAGTSSTETVTKAEFATLKTTVEKLQGDIATKDATIAEQGSALKAANEQLERVSKMLAPTKVVVNGNAIDKDADTVAAKSATQLAVEAKDPLAVIKAIQHR